MKIRYVRHQFRSNERVDEIEVGNVPDGITVRDENNAVMIGFLANDYVMVYKNQVGVFGAEAYKSPAQINWCGCGSKEISFTSRFIVAIAFAMAVAEEINKIKQADARAAHLLND